MYIYTYVHCHNIFSVTVSLYSYLFCSNRSVGGWSSEGIIQDTDLDVPIVCNSTHLTSFSVLVSTEQPPEVCDINPIQLQYNAIDISES